LFYEKDTFALIFIIHYRNAKLFPAHGERSSRTGPGHQAIGGNGNTDTKSGKTHSGSAATSANDSTVIGECAEAVIICAVSVQLVYQRVLGH
jgi:hypothetical protein